VINNIFFGYSFLSWHNNQYIPLKPTCQPIKVSDPLRFTQWKAVCLFHRTTVLSRFEVYRFCCRV
jgi:hypothetical protein